MRAKWKWWSVGGFAAVAVTAGLYGALRAPADGWQEFRGDDGGYRVSVPSLRGRVPKADCGTNGDLAFCMFRTDHSHLGVTIHRDAGRGNGTVDDQAVQRELAEQGGELVGKVEAVTVDGVSGIDYTIRNRDGNSIRTRAFHDRERIVEVRGVSRNVSEPEASRAEADAFITSFHFTDPSTSAGSGPNRPAIPAETRGGPRRD